MSDLASGETVLGTFTPVQLFAGESDVITESFTNSTAVVKYEVVARNSTTGALIPFVPGGTGDQTKAWAITTQPNATTSDKVAAFTAGFFNHEALVWPSGFNTYETRRLAFATNPMIKIGKLHN